MILKPLIILSLVYNLVGFSLSSGKIDQKIASFYSNENVSSAKAGNMSQQIPDILQLPEIRSGAPEAYINTREYILVDLESGEILNQKDPTKRVPIASTTKIMSAIVALENYSLNEVVTIPAPATTQAGADANLRVGEKISVLELLYCMLIKSGNDSAYALASYMDKSEKRDIDTFVKKMNQKAEELGMEDTNYLDPAGLDASGYSSANDLAIITRYALKNSTFRKIVATTDYVATNIDKTIYHVLKNSNRLVDEYQYPGAIGVKTGFMPEASHCLVGAAERNGHGLIVVILGTYQDTASASADEARKLLDWGFDNVIWKD